MSNHTKGPWIAMEGFSSEVVITSQDRVEKSLVSICEMDVHFEGDIGAEQKANTHLITAAPDLLAALRELRIAASANPKHQSVKAYRARKSAALAAADAVIAKAEGRQP